MFVSRQKLSPTVAAARAKGADKNDMADSPCSGRTDSIYDSGPDLSFLDLDVRELCPCSPRLSCQSRQLLDGLIFSDGWLDGLIFSAGSAQLMARAVAPHEAGTSCRLLYHKNATISASGCAAGTDLYTEWCSAELAQESSNRRHQAQLQCANIASCPHSPSWKRLENHPQSQGDVGMF